MLNDTQINDVRKFMVACGQDISTFNVRQISLYIGLVLEETAEMLGAVGMESASQSLDYLGQSFKSGQFDEYVESADREAILDANIDSIWVHLGAAFSQGANVSGAWHTVAQANLSKIAPNGRVVRDANGKICKPEGWVPPDLRSHVRKERKCD